MPKAKSHKNIGAILAAMTIGGMSYVHYSSGGQSPFQALFSGLPQPETSIEFIPPLGLALAMAFLIGSRAAVLPDRLDRLIHRHRGPFHAPLVVVSIAVIGFLVAFGVLTVGPGDIWGFYLRVALLSAIVGYISHPLADSLDSILPFR
jgi:type IV secretory pathway VirB2 component (pilin)